MPVPNLVSNPRLPIHCGRLVSIRVLRINACPVRHTNTVRVNQYCGWLFPHVMRFVVVVRFIAKLFYLCLSNTAMWLAVVFCLWGRTC